MGRDPPGRCPTSRVQLSSAVPLGCFFARPARGDSLVSIFLTSYNSGIAEILGGMDNAEIAESLGLATRTLDRQRAYARAWLFRYMSEHT